MDDAVEFFEEHAGWGYNPATETPEEGKHRGAVELAAAESWATFWGVTFTWSDDWSIGDHAEEYGEAYEAPYGEPETCELVVADVGPLYASLGCIDGATPEYRRVIEAELASELRYEASKRGRGAA